MEETQKRLHMLEEENRRLRAELDETHRGMAALTHELAAANENLQKQAEQQQSLLSSIPVYVYLKNYHLNYITANKAMADMLEIGVDEFAGKSDYDFFPHEQAKLSCDLDQKIIETGQAVYNLEELYTAPNGQSRWMLSTKVPLHNAGGTVTGIVGTLVDITERKKIEDSAQIANTSLKQRIDELSALNYIIQTVASVTDLDAALNTVSQTITTLFSAHGTGIILFSFGHSKQTLTAYHTREADKSGSAGLAFLIIGDSLTSDLLENQQPLLISPARPHPALKQNQSLIAAHHLTCLMFIPLLIRGEMIGYINVNSDQPNYEFTPDQVKLAEMIAGHIAGAIENSRLFNAEQEQRQMAESLRQVATVLNSSLGRENVIAKILAQLKRVVKFDSAGLFLQEGNELVLTDGAGLNATRIGNRVRISSQNLTVRPFADKKSYVIGDVHLHPDWELWQGDERIRAWMGAPLLIGNQALGVLTTDSIDVGRYDKDEVLVLQIFANQAAIAIKNAQLFDEAQKAKDSAEVARASAEAANQAKSIFLASISHELRTPLNGILGYTQILTRGHDLTPKQQKGIDIIHRSGEHLLMMINDVLDLSKIEAEKLELLPDQIHFGSFLKTITEIIQVRATQKDINFQYQAMSHLPPAVEADETRLRQVLLNLLGNAVKFTEHGSVLFKVGYTNSAQWANTGKGPAANAGKKVRFMVKDDGIGIPPENQAEIFLPFHQAGNKQMQAAGTGLGLAISQNLVQLMGGQIQVDSKVGAGSTFWFDINLPERPWDATADEMAKQEIVGYTFSAGKPLKILVVDDQPENRLVLTGLLEPLGFELHEATDGIEAISVAQQTIPDLILMDLIMPEMDGFEATRQIRHNPQLKNAVIIAISASAFDKIKQKSVAAGCNDYLSKPFQAEELLEKLRIHLRLEWHFKEVAPPLPGPADKEKEVFVPPAQLELSDLYDLVLIGDVVETQKLATKIMEADPTLSAFALHINRLADNFQLDELQDFIEEYLQDTP